MVRRERARLREGKEEGGGKQRGERDGGESQKMDGEEEEDRG